MSYNEDPRLFEKKLKGTLKAGCRRKACQKVHVGLKNRERNSLFKMGLSF
jgi:hypothetical protein